MAVKNFSENITLDNGSKIHRDRNLIEKVCILQEISRNNRIYKGRALQSVQSFVNSGTKSFVDHGELTNISVLKILGEFRNCVRDRNTLYADLSILSGSPAREIVFDIAENAPHLAGFSIAGQGKFADRVDEDGREVIEDVLSLRSIDFVGIPASTSGVFEQEGSSRELTERIQELEETVREKNSLISFLYNELEKKKSKPEITNEEGKALIVTAIKGKRYGTLIC